MKGFLIWAYAACYTKPRMSRKTLRNKLFPVWEVESLEACIYRCHDVYGIYEYDVPANISDGLHAWQNSVIEFLMKKEYDNELCDNLIENLQQFSHE